MSRVGYCVTVYLFLLARAPAAFCLSLPQQELGEPHFAPELSSGGIPNSDEPGGFEHRKGLQDPEGLQHPINDPLAGHEPQLIDRFGHTEEGLPNEINSLQNSQGSELGQQQHGLLKGLKPDGLQRSGQHDYGQDRNAEGLLQSNELTGLKKTQELQPFQLGEQSNGRSQELKSKGIHQFDLGFGHEDKEGLLQSSELIDTENTQGAQNLEPGQQQNDVLQRLKSKELPGLEQLALGQENKQEGQRQPFELNGLNNSQGVRGFELGQQHSGILQGIQSEGRQHSENINLGRMGKEEVPLQESQINEFNNVQGLRSVELGEQQKNLEKFNSNRLERMQNINLQQQRENQDRLQANKLNILKNSQRQRDIQLELQQNGILEDNRFNGVKQIQDLALQQEKKEQQMPSLEFNGHPNQEGFSQPIQPNQRKVQEISRFTQSPGFQQTLSDNQPRFPHQFYYNGNQPDQPDLATIHRMIDEARILAQDLRNINLNLKNPTALPILSGSPIELTQPDIIPSNRKSFSVNVQPASQSNEQSVVSLDETSSQSLEAELETADKILLDDLARRGFRINAVTHKLERIPGVSPIIQSAPVGQPEVLGALSSVEGALETTVSQISATEQVAANADSSSQPTLPPSDLTILNSAELSSKPDWSGQDPINVDTPSAEDVPGQLLIHATSSSSQIPSSPLSISVASSSSPSSSGQSEQVTINGISASSSSMDNQLNPVRNIVDSTISQSIKDLPSQAIIDYTSNIAGSPTSSVSVSAVESSSSANKWPSDQVIINGAPTTLYRKVDQSTPVPYIGSSVTRPNVGDLPGEVMNSFTSPSTESSVSTSSSSGGEQSGEVSITIDSNISPDLPGQDIIGTTSSLAKSPVSVTASSTGEQPQEVTFNGITTTSSSKYFTSPSAGNLTGQVTIDTMPSSVDSLVLFNAFSPSSSVAGGQSDEVTINEITTTSPSTISSNDSPYVGDLPGQIKISPRSPLTGSLATDNVINTSSSSTSEPAGQVTIDEVTTDTSQTDDQAGSVSLTLGRKIPPFIGDLPGRVISTSTSPSMEISVSANKISNSSSSTDNQSRQLTLNGGTITTSSKEDQSGPVSVTVDSEGTVGLSNQQIIESISSSIGNPVLVNEIGTKSSSTGQSEKFPLQGRIKVTSTTSPTENILRSLEENPTSQESVIAVNSSPTSGENSGQVTINGVSTTSTSTPELGTATISTVNIPTSVIDGQHPIITSTSSHPHELLPGFNTELDTHNIATTISNPSFSVPDERVNFSGSPVLVNEIRSRSSSTGQSEKFPLQGRIKVTSTTSPTENILRSLEENPTSPESVIVVNSSPTSGENSGQVTINGVSTTSTSTPELETAIISTVNIPTTVIGDQHPIITSTSSHPHEVLPGFDTVLDAHNIETTISGVSEPDSQYSQLHVGKRYSTKPKSSDTPIDTPILIDPEAHKNHEMSQLIIAPKNADKLFQLILKFNSSLDKYINLHGNEQEPNTKHASIIQLPGDKKNLGPAEYSDVPYLREEWHNNVNNEIQESGSTVDRHFDWTGSVHANSCHGDCNAEPACGFTCGRTCVDYKVPSRFCNRQEKCNVGACQCKVGFVLDLNTNRCVHPDQCSQCGPNEFLDECPDLCLLEECPSGEPQSACRVSDDCPKPLCRCIINHRRNKDDVCIPIQQCPKLECYGPNEVYTPCSRENLDENCESGLAHCFTSKIRNQSPVVCIPRCTCAPGHLRNHENDCVPVEECSSRSQRQEDFNETNEEEVIED